MQKLPQVVPVVRLEDEAALSLARRHQPLVAPISRRLQRWYSWVGVDDLKSYAYVGLALAARAYQPQRGVPFDRFAVRKGAYLAIDEMRRDGVVHRRRSPDAGLSPLPDTLADPTAGRRQHDLELREDCRALLAQLRDQDRLLIYMHYTEELTFREIGEVFGISESAVSLRHKAILIRLRRMIRGKKTRIGEATRE